MCFVNKASKSEEKIKVFFDRSSTLSVTIEMKFIEKYVLIDLLVFITLQMKFWYFYSTRCSEKVETQNVKHLQ